MKQIIFIVILLMLTFGTGYLWYSYSSDKPAVEEVHPEFSGASLTELQRLKTLRLDVSILKDPIFGSLISPSEILGTEVTQIQAGRVNPFLPF